MLHLLQEYNKSVTETVLEEDFFFFPTRPEARLQVFPSWFKIQPSGRETLLGAIEPKGNL